MFRFINNKIRIFELWSIALLAILNISCGGRIALGTIESKTSDWYTIGGTFSRSSLVASSHLTPPLTLVWKKQFMVGVATSPLVLDEIVFIPFLNGELVTLKLRDGKKLAKKKFGRGPIFGLTISGNIIYFGMSQEKISFRAYNISRGRYKWKAQLSAIESAPMIIENRLFVGSRDHRFYCIDIRDGSTIWKKRETAPITVSPEYHSGSIIYCDLNGTLFKRNGVDGELIWKNSLGPSHQVSNKVPYSHLVINQDRVYLSTIDGDIYAADARNGTIEWHQEFKEPIYSSVSADSLHVYIPTSSGKVYCIRQDDGIVVWTYDSGSIINKEIVVTDSLLVIATQRGDLIVLEKDTGYFIWSNTVKGRIIAPPVVQSGFLIVADDKKWIYAFASEKLNMR